MAYLRSAALIAAAVVLTGAGIGRAQGVAEINQARVAAGGITPGDAPGFPATLSRSGSYVLTGNLTVPENVDGIDVTANDVAIDLQGFTIVGPGGEFAGAGIEAASPARTNVRVRDGSVRGMGRGVVLAQDSRVESVHVLGSAGDGITIGARSIATRNTATGNVGRGIVASVDAIARHNVTGSNTGEVFETWLLFPFVTNQAGFDTALVIANTTKNPAGLGTNEKSGTCTLTSYGTNAPAPFTSPAIVAGVDWTALASGSMPNFQGYVIARCTFPLAHGYGFLSDLGARSLAASAPALVIQPGRTQDLPEGLAR